MRCLIVLLVCGLWVHSDAQSCSAKKDAECKCTERIETGSDVRMLMQRKTDMAQTCLRQNPTKHQGCYNKTVAMMTCHAKVITMLDQDNIFKQAKADAMRDLDTCMQVNSPNAFDSVMMLMQKGPGGKGGPPGKRGKKGPGGSGERGPPPPMMDGPMPEPMGMGMKRGGMGADPSECLQMIIRGLYGGNERRGPPPMEMGDNMGPPPMFGGPDMRPGPPKQSCFEFEMCMMEAKKKAGSDPSLMSAARRIVDQKNKCTTDNMDTFDCIPSTPERQDCMESAMKPLMFYKMMKMKSCMKEAGVTMPDQF